MLFYVLPERVHLCVTEIVEILCVCEREIERV